MWNAALQAYHETEADFGDVVAVSRAGKSAPVGDELKAASTFDAAAVQWLTTAEP